MKRHRPPATEYTVTMIVALCHSDGIVVQVGDRGDNGMIRMISSIVHCAVFWFRCPSTPSRADVFEIILSMCTSRQKDLYIYLLFPL